MPNTARIGIHAGFAPALTAQAFGTLLSAGLKLLRAPAVRWVIRGHSCGDIGATDLQL